MNGHDEPSMAPGSGPAVNGRALVGSDCHPRQSSKARLALRSLVTAIALILSGCGFHLAGSRPLPEPLKSVYVDMDLPYTVQEPPVEVALRARLLRRGAKVTTSQEEATCTVRLRDLDEKREVLSVGPDGKALEFLLTTSVRYEVIGREGILLPSDTLVVSRDYFFNAQQVLAKEAEEARLRDYIQNALADLLLLRLEARLK
jgi:LPS-assembly lipoprotein